MGQMDDITNELAKKFSGLSLEQDKAKPKAADLSDIDPDRRTSVPVRPAGYSDTSYRGGNKLFPSERMELRDWKQPKQPPKRPQVLISHFSDSDLEWMLNTPVKRGWEFSDWLEVIGLPRDLHEQHDAPLYGYVAKAFLRHKRDAHSR